MCKGRLFIVSGPSGCGKDTILSELFSRRPDIRFSISTVTRAMRQGECEGQKYHFVSREEFLALLEAGEFLEYNEFVGNYYGTPRTPVEVCIANGEDIILEIDVNGAAKVRSQMPEAVSIFIMPPSIAELKRRLERRGTETPQQIESRAECAKKEMKRAIEYDYIVVNDDLQKAVDDLASVLRSDGLKRDRQEQILDEVLKQC